jgi:MFS family permease
MLRRVGQLLGITILWLPLSMLFDGLNALLLPAYILGLVQEDMQGTVLGAITFSGLLLGMLVQPLIGVLSDRWYPRWGRRPVIVAGVIFLLPLLFLLSPDASLPLLLAAYLLIQIAGNIIQTGVQAFIPDRIPRTERGLAAGIKNLMDIGGAMLVFLLLAQFFSQGQPELVTPIIGGVLLVTFLLTMALVRERDRQKESQQQVSLTAAFRINLREHRAFAWLVVSRFLFLLGTYVVGRFLLFFTAERLNLNVDAAGEQTAVILSMLTLIAVLCAPIAGWLADRVGRLPLMLLGAGASALGVLLLMAANSAVQMLLFGSLMSVGSALFAASNWALAADLVPRAEAARFLALANFGTAGAAAAAGLFGPLIDLGNRLQPGTGYVLLFIAATSTFAASGFAALRMNTPPLIVQPAETMINR